MNWLEKLPTWLMAISLGAIAVAFVLVLAVRPDRFEFAGMAFGFENDEADTTIPSIPSGAVVAFDITDGCPEGWSLFEPGISRAIVGAVGPSRAKIVPNGVVDENGMPLSPRQFRRDGGEEAVELKIENVPAHVHGAGTLTAVDAEDYQHRTDDSVAVEPTLRVKHALFAAPPHNANYGEHMHSVSGETARTGGDASNQTISHNNMPPYIALYYCKKD